ncbi:LysR family transcriptional regulator [Shimia abyssi]|uniref:LysR family transcriptional regulator n=1 Tax=Shimia abyssi TaxID=1662395 RepID=A0A2P8FBT6_9RHOB|nr:LysR family transcriptional regulator [Shimia abyssi]PSL19132.1 LysR family transcriptional regulator [Shimia abyssi]
MTNRNEMATPRRFLPSLSWLAAFEAVVRCGGVTRAARELNLTQGAVSRQIQKLEAQIGVQLFERSGQRLILTESGKSYFEDIRTGINLIANAGIRLHVNPDGGALNLAVPPAFATHWLAPRLPGFVTAHPGVTVNITTRIKPFDFSNEDLHAAIHFGEDDWPETDSLLLMREEAVAIASPDLLPAGHSGDLTGLPLLHLETRPNAWDIWLTSENLTGQPQGGFRFDQFGAMIQAVRSGLGAAVVPRYLVDSDLEAGHLVKLGSQSPVTVGNYYLVWPDRHGQYPPVVAFRSWIEGIRAAQDVI